MYYLFIMRQVICWFVYIGNWFVYIGKNPRFTAFFDSNLHTRLAIVTKNELGLAFSPRNLPKKFRPDPSTFYLVIVVTNRQTDRQTYARDYIIPRESFRGDNYRLYHFWLFPGLFTSRRMCDAIYVQGGPKTGSKTHDHNSVGLLITKLGKVYC